ncbi:hypothetical protein GCM10009737_01040 [Nocardioides lentus]|uniref:Lipoprotein n=1 Tax=Nocardioides lentus TaxID=338077 RepID=A0ABN2NW60_9ACTN
MRPTAALLGLLLVAATACGGGGEEPAPASADTEVCEIGTRVVDLFDRSKTDGSVRMGRVYAGARDDVAAVADDVTVAALRPAVEDVLALAEEGPIAEPAGTDAFGRLTVACVGESLP